MRKSVNDLIEEARRQIQRLEPDDAYRAMQRGAILIDTRCGEARTLKGSVPGSIHVPLSVLYWRLDPDSPHRDPALANPDSQVILMCADGYSSSLAAATLRVLGYERAADVIGGFTAWSRVGLPVDRTAQVSPAASPASEREQRVRTGR